MSTPSFISDKYVWEGWCDLFICGWVKPFGWAWCHVGAPRGRAGGGGPLVQCLPSNAGRGGHKTSSHSFPSPQETPWQLGQKNKQKMGPPHHSWHALASPVKCLKSFTSVFFRVEITERALMWNMRLLSRVISSILHPTSFSLVPPSLKDDLHGYGSECEALIMPWLCFKGLAPSYNFPSVSRKNL